MTDDSRKARRLKRTELAVRALGKHGNPKKAAREIGIAESTLRKWVAEYCELNGFDSVVQAAYSLGGEDRISA